MILSRGRKPKREYLLEALAKEDTQIIALAYAHAQYLKMYGVDIEKALYTATENAEVMARAYQRGYYDAMEQGKDHQLKNVINKIKEIVDEWQSDTWTDNLSYECMVKVAELVEPQESEDLGDYPDAIPNQFDNMTGSMNL